MTELSIKQNQVSHQLTEGLIRYDAIWITLYGSSPGHEIYKKNTRHVAVHIQVIYREDVSLSNKLR